MKKIGKKSIVLAALVLLLGGAVYVNTVLTKGSVSLTDMVNNTSSQTKTLGTAELVNASANETEGLTQLRLDRTKTRDESVSVLKTVTENEALSAEERSVAVETLAEMMDAMCEENDIETLVKAKGFSDCIATVGDGAVTVTVKSAARLTAAEAAQIRDIAVSVTNYDGDLIKIVEVS